MTDPYIGVCTPPPANCEIVISKQPTCETPSTQQSEISVLPFPLLGLFSSPTLSLTPPTFTLPPLPPFPPPGNPGWPGPPGPPDIPIISVTPEPPPAPTQVVPEPSSIFTFVTIFAVGIIYIYRRKYYA